MRKLIAVFIALTACIAGALGLFRHHIGSAAMAVDTWLTEAGYQLQKEPIDPQWAVTRVAEAALPIAVFVAAGLVLVLIWLVLRGLRMVLIDHVPASRRRRRLKKMARPDPTAAPESSKDAA